MAGWPAGQGRLQSQGGLPRDFLLCLPSVAFTSFYFLEVIGERSGRKGDGKEETPKQSKTLCPNKALKHSNNLALNEGSGVRGQLTSTFSTTCFPKEQTLVEQVTVIFSELSY